MSTNCTIILKREDNTCSMIYVHYNGYSKHTGKTLLNHYNSFDKAKEIIEAGDLSQLQAVIEEKDKLNHQSTSFASLRKALNRFSFQHNYLFDEKSNKWFYSDGEILFPLETMTTI